MLTYSKIKELAIPSEFIITKENYKDIPNPHPDNKEYSNWEYSLSRIFLKRTIGPTHNFHYITNDRDAYYLQGGCTGSFASGRYTHPASVSAFTPAITGLMPYANSKDHQEYLNLLLHPLVSPYGWLMKPDNYKVKLNNKGDVEAYYFLDNETPAPYVAGLSILERTFYYLGSNEYLKTWKKEDKEDFSTFIFLTQFIHFNLGMYSGLNYPYIQHPYSTFDMFTGVKSNGVARGRITTRFSGPRFFQQIPNHTGYDDHYTNKIKRKLKDNSGHVPSNLVWSSESSTSDAKLTGKFETEMYEFVHSNIFERDEYGRNKLTITNKMGDILRNTITKYKDDIPNLTRMNANTSPIIKEYQDAIHQGSLEIARKYIPLFRTEEVA